MQTYNRREFLLATIGATLLPVVELPGRPRIGLVRSNHPSLAKPSSPEDPLDYERVRDMVWKAIGYGKPEAGSLDAKIKPGSWVVVKPNIVSLPGLDTWAPGDITDFRVTRAVIEYLARYSRAGRITLAEGGSYRKPEDATPDCHIIQDERKVDAYTYAWNRNEFPGLTGSMETMLAAFRKDFPGKRFDYSNLSYDTIRDASGAFRRFDPPKTAKGVGAFGLRKDYAVANTIVNCDFLVSVPVMKVHNNSGITACFKNYVGTAPREAYAVPGRFSNSKLHSEHSFDGRIDPFIIDLASFHPPDYNVVDGIRGIQYSEHNTGRPDQTVRSNLILAGEDTVSMDTMVAYLLGYNPWDIEFLHMAAQRDLGVFDLQKIDLAGDDPVKIRREWAKPRNWYGRCNREWMVSGGSGVHRRTTPGDTLDFGEVRPGSIQRASVKVIADGNRKAYLWTGARGRVTATLNGQKVLEEEAITRYRVGQYQRPVELKSGENLLTLEIQAVTNEAKAAVLFTGPSNNGDSIEGIRWKA